jgi:hypothetical protein
MAAWANILRRRYGIIWPISLISDGDDHEDDQPQQVESIIYGN